MKSASAGGDLTVLSYNIQSCATKGVYRTD